MSLIDKVCLKEGGAALGVTLNEQQLEQFETVAVAMLEQNKVMNVTRIPAEEMVVKHFLDSLAAAKAVNFSEASTLLDVGAGCGMPGLALKIAFPHLETTLLDSREKIIEYLKTTCAKLCLSGMSFVAGRAEALGGSMLYRERFDVVTARALADMRILAELTAPFAKAGGFVAALKSQESEKEIGQAEPIIKALGCSVEVKRVALPATEITRLIAVLHKRAPTPRRYPRSWKTIING